GGIGSDNKVTRRGG
nr:Chain C, HST4 peptide [synthetic construct]7N19_F Chain F, HST4 peptide [synthetic construct]7N19_I Chain I, HST4 peptide [synthetic construct]7N19_L Chain L, HST4 peptide [synthetic construct]